jgi:hypothetical protein
MSNELQVFDELKAEVQIFVGPTLAVKVTTAQESQAALEALKTIKLLSIRLEKKRTEIVKPLNDRVKQVNAYANSIEDPLTKAERHLKQEVARFDDGLRAQAAAKLAEERKAAEAEERKARERQIELDREIEERRKAALDELKVTAEIKTGAASFFGDDEPAVDLAEERRRIDEEAEKEKIARQVQAEREQIAREIAMKERQYDIENARTKGIKRVWDFTIEDLEAVPRDYLKIEVNRQLVLAAARGGLTEIPGLKLFQKTELAVGAHTRIAESLLEDKG